MMELARPTMKRKEPLTAAPAETSVVAKATSMAPTYDTAEAPNPVYMLVDIGRDGDGDVLRTLWVSRRAWGIQLCLTTTMTMVLCPSEKNRPQVTGS